MVEGYLRGITPEDIEALPEFVDGEFRKLDDVLNTPKRIGLPPAIWVDGNPAPSILPGSGVFTFTSATNRSITTSVKLPFSVSDPILSYIWTPSNANSGNIYMRFRYRAIEIGAASPGYTTVYGTDVCGSNTNQLAFVELTGLTVQANSMFEIIFERYAAHANDTYGSDSYVRRMDLLDRNDY